MHMGTRGHAGDVGRHFIKCGTILNLLPSPHITQMDVHVRMTRGTNNRGRCMFPSALDVRDSDAGNSKTQRARANKTSPTIQEYWNPQCHGSRRQQTLPLLRFGHGQEDGRHTLDLLRRGSSGAVCGDGEMRAVVGGDVWVWAWAWAWSVYCRLLCRTRLPLRTREANGTVMNTSAEQMKRCTSGLLPASVASQPRVHTVLAMVLHGGCHGTGRIHLWPLGWVPHTCTPKDLSVASPPCVCPLFRGYLCVTSPGIGTSPLALLHATSAVSGTSGVGLTGFIGQPPHCATHVVRQGGGGLQMGVAVRRRGGRQRSPQETALFG